ncbi:Carbohydrate binding module (family 6) [Actinokineospora alba]|uniref:Carbohydrate binding module (Family 6) n=1 Tax=Actinokineospora alba TaxID=504798 RepID=A0A1H0EYR9_9PSEU|nr:carbohydrate-binding protein [Actinokineospora alba]TDP69278.1 carbohydrate binding protein with CBM6 domain [Actinokineospora alba]SDI20399.1 Carbohydrate binding module (family 6) [Actinokineospora alba]SDN87567.1 Carbohydrate binding module (family 6) [Actinokineospora alba]
MPHLSPAHRRPLALAVVAALAVATPVVLVTTVPAAGQAAAGLDLSPANRRAPIPGLYDWSKAGFRGGATLPGANEINPDAACQLTPAELAGQHGVRPGDGVDDSAGLQAAIDAVRTRCSPSAGYAKLSLITLPAGVLDVSRQLAVDADYLVIRGAGSDPAAGTRIVFRPDANTRYDTLTPDGSDWDEDGMTHGQGKGGWLWPGRGLFRVQSRAVHTAYASDYASAPANRKDIFEGTANVHWKAGVQLGGKAGDTAFSARTGDRVVQLASSGSLTGFTVGGLVNIRAANSVKFYEQQKAVSATHPMLNQHMRQQLFTITAVDTANRRITLDKPLEYDVPVSSTSDGSAPIDGAVYPSKASPIVDPVVGVGFENLSFTQAMPTLDPAKAVHNYGNMSPADQMHGIVFKWAANSWVRGVRADMTGSHPIVTEEAKNLQIVDNHLDGAWNKGKGGNGYFRGSRVWDSLYAGNTSRNLRHFTFQWSASGNVVIGNDFDSDLNLHGGWERHNLFELNTVTVPYAHRSANCLSNCGEEGGGGPDDSNWFPIWWGAGQKAVKWSGSTGPRNVFFNNTMKKQLTSDTDPYVDYYPDRHRVYQFGWSGTGWHHLDKAGAPITDWANNERGDYTGGHGVDASKTDAGQSLFLKSVGSTPPTTTTTTAPPAPDRYEAENAVCQGTVDSDHAGYTGTGFCNTTNAVGASVEWTVTAAAGSHTLTFRYANGSTGRPADVSVNGAVVADDLAFPSTGAWATWRTVTTTATLSAGTNKIRVTAGTSGGTANLDHLVITAAASPADIVDVSTSDQLRSALTNARPGRTIRMAAGTYRGTFLSQKAGTASAPITLTGPRNAVLINDGPSGTAPSCSVPTAGWDSGYGLWLFDAPHWNLTGFTVAESKKGIVLDNSHHVTIDGVYVHHTEEEGVHFRRSSADGVLKRSRIEQIGLVKPGYGEGVYIGSANSNWGCLGNSGGMDRSDRVQVLDNQIGPGVAAEHIDIKEGTQGGVIRGNTFDGRGLSGQNSADSWIDAKGNNYLIEQNRGTFAAPGTFVNGYETHNPVTGYGCGNVWRSNTSDLGGVGNYAVYISSTSKCTSAPNKVYASNTVTNARNGLTNIPVTP